MRDQHLKDGKGFILVFAVNDKNSVEEIKQLKDQIIKLKETKKVPFVVCCNKADLPVEMHEVNMGQVEKYFEELKIPFFKTSAKVAV